MRSMILTLFWRRAVFFLVSLMMSMSILLLMSTLLLLLWKSCRSGRKSSPFLVLWSMQAFWHFLWLSCVNLPLSRLVQAWTLSCTECWWESWLVFSPWSSSGGGLAGKGLEEVCSNIFLAINRELSVFSWLMATCVAMADKHLRQFTLVKHHVWLDLSASDNHCSCDKLSWHCSSKSPLCAVVLVCGVSDSGKTSVLGQLVAGKALETVTSMIENRWTLLNLVTWILTWFSGQTHMECRGWV